MKEIDMMIKILKRVNNCDQALSNLKQAQENLLFKGVMDKKYADHVNFLICESIKLIENDEDENGV